MNNIKLSEETLTLGTFIGMLKNLKALAGSDVKIILKDHVNQMWYEGISIRGCGLKINQTPNNKQEVYAEISFNKEEQVTIGD